MDIIIMILDFYRVSYIDSYNTIFQRILVILLWLTLIIQCFNPMILMFFLLIFFFLDQHTHILLLQTIEYLRGEKTITSLES